MNIRIIAAALAVLLGSFAFVTAVNASGVKVPDGCKIVQIKRPNINPRRPTIYLTFTGVGGNVSAVKHCNPRGAEGIAARGVVASSTAGAQVTVYTTDGAGNIALPDMYTEGVVHQNVCTPNDDFSDYTASYYEAVWAGGLKANITLIDVTATKDMAILRAECERTMPPDVRARLAKKKD